MSRPDLARLLGRAATLLQADPEHRTQRFAMQFDGYEFECVATLVWRLREIGLRVVVRDAVTGLSLCDSLPGRVFEMDLHEDDEGEEDGVFGVPPDAPKEFPEYMAYLVDRAASHLEAVGWRKVVSFTWWADGERSDYTARIDWHDGELDPRVVVFARRSGEFVCKSVPGRLYEIDPLHWEHDVPIDEYEYSERASAGAGARRRGAAA